jgi:hypothetical protein
MTPVAPTMGRQSHTTLHRFSRGSTRRGAYSLIFLLAALASIAPILAQSPKQSVTLAARFWLAGRYDGNHIIALFDEIKFNGTVPRTARFVSVPTTPGFLTEQELSANYVAQLPHDAKSERFRIGDQYDVLLGDGRVEPVTISTLIGYVSDDEDDDPSYIGAIAKVADPATLIGTQSYFALRRHQVVDTALEQSLSTPASASLANKAGIFAALSEVPVRFDLESKVASLLSERMRTMQPSGITHAESLPPTLAVQQFRLHDGTWRYYARAEWREETSPGGPPSFALAAWITPDLKILAVEKLTSPYGFPDELPELLNVIDLGNGSTGIIVNITESGEGSLGLWEYRDGADLAHMKNFQKIEMDE